MNAAKHAERIRRSAETTRFPFLEPKVFSMVRFFRPAGLSARRSREAARRRGGAGPGSPNVSATDGKEAR